MLLHLKELKKNFSLEFVGVKDGFLSGYGDKKIKEFHSSIVYKKNAYHKNIPWDEKKNSLGTVRYKYKTHC